MPLLLDLFCGAGGAAFGYHQAGFEVIGVDIKPQKNFPFPFIQADALEFLATAPLGGFDLIHASPPCQAYSVANNIHQREHPRLIEGVRDLLIASGKPYVIENVPGSPLVCPVVLCGTMFGLGVYRHRWFECSQSLLAPECMGHKKRPVKTGRPAKDGDIVTVAGHFSSMGVACRAMGIDWMVRDELAQAIPPAYTKWLGEMLLEAGLAPLSPLEG